MFLQIVFCSAGIDGYGKLGECAIGWGLAKVEQVMCGDFRTGFDTNFKRENDENVRPFWDI